jgi:hypothetical protein
MTRFLRFQKAPKSGLDDGCNHLKNKEKNILSRRALGWLCKIKSVTKNAHWIRQELAFGRH